MDRVEAVLREFVLAAMPGATGALADLPLRSLLSEYGTSRSRVPEWRPRAVHVAPQLTADPRAAKVRRDAEALIAKIEAGEDLTAYLSDRVLEPRDPGAESQPLSARRDRDLLLAEWGVHHLHLTPGHGPDLLFVAFRPDDAYVIGLYSHSDFARKGVLERMVHNWPDSELVHKVSSGLELSQQWSDREHKHLRENGISGPFIEVDGAVWAAASLGMAMDGTPLLVAHAAMGLAWTLDDWREHLDERLREAAEGVDQTLGHKAVGDWEPTVHAGEIGIVRDGCFTPIGRLP
ncbi:MAG: hypothetical protein JWM60_1455 [Solirubrobacterales bacterium]|nr:hypothetical protein [Solirubrobacterales bacterium]